MSLSSFLLKPADSVDSELDALFNAESAVPITSSTHHFEPEVQSKKRKLAKEKSGTYLKRQKSDHKQEEKKPSSKKPNAKALVPSSVEEGVEGEDEENSDLEATYLRFKEENGPLQEDEETIGDDNGDASNLVHESLAGKSKSKSKSNKQKYVPPDETPAQRDQRTIFIGNLSLEVAQKRPLQKQLQRHILSFISTAKIESVRFRSVPFSSPATSTVTNAPTDQLHKNPSQREHDRTRASSWHSSETTPNPTEAKTHLTQNQKKKILFLTHQFHTSGTTIHAYVVFAPPPPSSTRPLNLPPLPDIMNPYEAAKQAVKKVDGTEFEGRIIRVDFVGKSAKGNAREEKEEGEKDMVVENKAFKDADPKCTLFVGNLDLAAQEEDLRAFFENLMKKERGEPPETAGAEVKMKKIWVNHVRIIRDKETQVGKGFGYIQFTDRECVDELLTLEPTQLKFAKRKLRIQRCKTLPGTKLSSSIKSSLRTLPSSTTDSTTTSKTKSKDSKTKHQRPAPAPASGAPIIIPKGDPSLGTKLASMSKQERKVVKAADVDRVARRLAKKKARMAMGTKKDLASVKFESGQGEKRRVRVRKDVPIGGKEGGKGKERKKVRVRSERSLEKRNAKK